MRHSKATWEAVGAALARQRGRIDPNARRFSQSTGLNARLIYDIENGRRDNYRPQKIAQVEAAYQLPPGWVTESLAQVEAGEDPLPLPGAVEAGAAPPRELTAEELDHPVVRSILDLEGPPSARLTIGERIAKARETHRLIQAGAINPTVHHLDDPTVRTILAITGVEMAHLWDVALHDYANRAEIARRAAEEGRDAG